jgi:hypothetical protein
MAIPVVRRQSNASLQAQIDALTLLVNPKIISSRAIVSTGSNVDIVYGQPLVNTNPGTFNGTTFVPADNGIYEITVNHYATIGAGGAWNLGVYIGGVLAHPISAWGNGPAGGSAQPANGSIKVPLLAGQQVTIRITGSGLVDFGSSNYGTVSYTLLRKT